MAGRGRARRMPRPRMALDGVARSWTSPASGFGAQATLICGCLGAEVIRVESTRRPDADPGDAAVRPRAGRARRGVRGGHAGQRHRRRSPNRGRDLLQVQHRREALDHRRRPPPRGPGRAQATWWRSATSSPRASRPGPWPAGASATSVLREHHGPTSSTCPCAASATPAPTAATSPWAPPPRP